MHRPLAADGQDDDRGTEQAWRVSPARGRRRHEPRAASGSLGCPRAVVDRVLTGRPCRWVDTVARMNFRVGPPANHGARIFGIVATILIVGGLAGAAPAAADRNQCAPPGVESATVLPADLMSARGTGASD